MLHGSCSVSNQIENHRILQPHPSCLFERQKNIRTEDVHGDDFYFFYFHICRKTSRKISIFNRASIGVRKKKTNAKSQTEQQFGTSLALGLAPKYLLVMLYLLPHNI